MNSTRITTKIATIKTSATIANRCPSVPSASRARKKPLIATTSRGLFLSSLAAQMGTSKPPPLVLIQHKRSRYVVFASGALRHGGYFLSRVRPLCPALDSTSMEQNNDARAERGTAAPPEPLPFSQLCGFCPLPALPSRIHLTPNSGRAPIPFPRQHQYSRSRLGGGTHDARRCT